MDLSQDKTLKPPILPPERIQRVSGYGMTHQAEGYVFRPTNVTEIREILLMAQRLHRKVALRGAGRSYGDANVGAECIVLDTSRLDRILEWDPVTGRLTAECGVTLERIWRHTLEDGYWLPVVSGTSYATLGGALAMNIHGKNHFRAGTFGDHIVRMEVLTPDGVLRELTRGDPLFDAIIGSAGLLGIILSATIQMKRVIAGDLNVLPIPCKCWSDQFAAFQNHEPDADYMVGWVDMFASGKGAGRGLVHIAWHPRDTPDIRSLQLDYQELPQEILGRFSVHSAWRWLRRLNRPFWMRIVNALKYHAARVMPQSLHPQSLAAFSFLLDYVPNWRKAYLPGGFIQYQCFVPRDRAPDVFSRLGEMQRDAKLPAFLAVLKRHLPTNYLLDYSVDGYSLALDFKVTTRNHERLWRLCHQMNDVVLDSGGRFYFAKDSTLRPEDVPRFIEPGKLALFREYKARYDPHRLLTSDLARRLRLCEP